MFQTNSNNNIIITVFIQRLTHRRLVYNGITQVWEVLEWRQSAANCKVQPAGSLQPTPPLWRTTVLLKKWFLTCNLWLRLTFKLISSQIRGYTMLVEFELDFWWLYDQCNYCRNGSNTCKCTWLWDLHNSIGALWMIFHLLQSHSASCVWQLHYNRCIYNNELNQCN